MESLKFPMQESRSMPPRSAENTLLQPGVDGFPPAEDSPTSGQPPVTSLEDLKGKVISKAMEQHGCRLLLQKLQERKPEDIQMIFSEAKDYTCKLMFNGFCSDDVILKLFEVCDEEQKDQLVSFVTADAQLLISICLDSQGSESMKKFLGCPMTPKQVSHVMNVFSYFTVPLVNHQIGSQVIHHCLKIFPANETEPILQVIARDCMEIALDQNGSALLEFLISGDDYLKGGPLYLIVDTIVENSYKLSCDEFGTCLIHHLIGLEIPNLLHNLVDRLRGVFTLMWTDERASFVVKKLMGASKKKYAPLIIDDTIMSTQFLDALLYTRDSFLLQYAKSYAKGTARKTLNDLIFQYSQLLRTK